jgi:hypothetical protein
LSVTEEGQSRNELVVPGIGQIVNLDDPPEVAGALGKVRELESMLRSVKSELTAALVYASQRLGTKTLHLENCDVTIKSGSSTVYDPIEIEAGLRAAGMPEERIREIVKETVSYSVDAVKAKQAAGANPLYAAVIAKHSQTEEKQPYATIKW